MTWYKFKILETISKAKGHRVSEVDSPPADLLPIANDEILVWKTGRSVENDDLEIEGKKWGFPHSRNQKSICLF